MSVSNGNLDSLLNVTFTVDADQYGGVAVQSSTEAPLPSFVPTSVTVDTTGTPGAGAVGGIGETFQIVGVNDTNNSLTVAVAENGIAVSTTSEYVIGYTANAILISDDLTQQEIGESLNSNVSVDNLLAVLSPSALTPDTAMTFTSDGTFTAPLCFLPGTLIATSSGQTAVEQLAVGDTVRTHSGEARPIIWIGVGSVLATRGRRNAATPVIVRKGAFAPNCPFQDLRVTKAHSFYLDDALIPVEFLVNHRSIVWDDHAQEVKLYHIELETHDVLLANGAPAESYRDDGNRWLFQNGNTGWAFPPKEPCAPVLTGGPVVDAVWGRLLGRAGLRSGQPFTDDPDLHLLVDGQRIEADVRDGATHVFKVPAAPKSVRIVSRAAAPAELGLARDPRCLGVALRKIVVRQGTRFEIIKAKDPRLNSGFHIYEDALAYRWTDGDAEVPVALFSGITGSFELVLDVGAAGRYGDDGMAVRAA